MRAGSRQSPRKIRPPSSPADCPPAQWVGLQPKSNRGRVSFVSYVRRLLNASHPGSPRKSNRFPLTVTSSIHALPGLSQVLGIGSMPKCVTVAPSARCSFAIGAGGGLAIEREGQQAAAFGSVGVVRELPLVNAAAGILLRLDALAGDDLADDARAAAPAAGAVFEMAVEGLAPDVDAGHQSVGRSPLIECAGVEEAQQEMARDLVRRTSCPRRSSGHPA